MNSRASLRGGNLREDPEAGFTLLELVISIVLLTMVIGAISAAFVSSMTATSATKHRVNASNDAQLISGFLTRDAQAAGGTNPATGVRDPALGVWTGTFASGCSTAPPGTPILGLKWIDLTAGVTYESNYSYIATTTGSYQPQQLLRTICSTPNPAPATSVLANNVVTTATSTLSTPAAWCDNNGPASPSCPTHFPNTVSLGVSVNNATETLTPPFSFILTASLRPQSDSAADLGSAATTASLLVLSGSGTCINSSSQAFELTTYGAAALSGCSTNVSKLHPFGPVFAGSCVNWPDGTCTPVSTPFADPFQARIDAGLLTPPTVDCSNGPPPVGGNGHWQPGTYPQDPQAGGTIRTFDPGAYVFCNGLTGDVTANLQGGAIGGTFFYFYGGSYNCEKPTGNPPDISSSCTSTVQITPPTSGEYDGLAIWQAKPDASMMRFSKGVVNITGTAYVPLATVDMKNGNVNINQLIAYAVVGNPGSPHVHIGPPLRVTVQDPLPPGTVGQQYPGTQPIVQALALDGTGVYSGWTISGVTGLTINSTGLIGGTVGASVAPGPHTVTIGVNDNDGEHATVTASITINPALTISGSLPNSTVNQAGYPTNPLTAVGGSGTGYTWTATGLPTGLNMDATGAITGTPTIAQTYHASVTVTDSIGGTVTQPYTVTIASPVSVASISTTNIDGKPAQGDKIVITFSGAVRPSSVCSSWTASGANDTGNNTNTTITLTKQASGHNLLAVSDPTDCVGGFKIFAGNSLDLGTTGYVTTAGTSPTTAVFTTSGQCNGGHQCSQVAINAAHTQLTITLGALSSGTVGAVASNPGVTYTPNSAILDANGVAVSGLATDAAAKFF